MGVFVAGNKTVIDGKGINVAVGTPGAELDKPLESPWSSIIGTLVGVAGPGYGFVVANGVWKVVPVVEPVEPGVVLVIETSVPDPVVGVKVGVIVAEVPGITAMGSNISEF